MVSSDFVGKTPPDSASVSFYGCEYGVRLEPIREKLISLAAASGLGGAAERMGISRMTLHRLLNGKRIAFSTLSLIVECLGLRFGDIAYPITEDEPQPMVAA